MCKYGDVQIPVRDQSPRQTSRRITRMMLIMMRRTMTTMIFILMMVMYDVQVPVPVPSSSITATSLPVRLIANYRTKVLLLPCKSLFSFSCYPNLFLVHDINIEAPLKHLILINKRIYFELSSVGYLAKLALGLHKGAGL